MADEAWMCLLKDKIKEAFQASSGASMDNIARLTATACGEKWANKMASKKHCEDFRRDLEMAFAQGKKK